MPQPSRTPKILAALVALLAVAVIAAVFYRLGQDTPNTTPTPASTSTTPPGSLPSPAPASPSTGSSTSGLPRGPARAGEGGHMTGPAGLPLGYDHTETGAVQAATNYLTWMNSIRIKDKTTADAMAQATAANEETRDAMVDSFDELRTGLDDVSVSQVEPTRGAYAVAQYDDTHAAIYVWAPDLVVDSGESNTFWSISEVLLVRRDGDWKLDGGLVNRVGGAAVYPADPEGNPSAVEKHSILSRTPADPGEITDTAEQEWLEYSNAAR